MDQDGDFGTGARMIVTALVSAVVTATVVISIGQSMLDRASSRPESSRPALIRTVG